MVGELLELAAGLEVLFSTIVYSPPVPQQHRWEQGQGTLGGLTPQ